MTAGSGLTGAAFRKLATTKYSNHEFLFHTRSNGDLSKPYVFKFLLTDFKPDVIIHNASMLHGSFASEKSIETSKKTNTEIFGNLLKELLPHQQVYCLSSYHIFANPAPFDILDLESLNRNTSYALEKSNQIESSRSFPNVKFVILPHLFGEHDNFSPGRAHFIANSIRRIVTAKERQDAQIEFFGSVQRILQFSTAELATNFVLDAVFSNLETKEKYFLANVGWKRTCLEVFMNICGIVGFQGLVIPVNSDSKTFERNMYFPTNTNSGDVDKLAFLASLGTAIDYFKRGEIEYVD